MRGTRIMWPGRPDDANNLSDLGLPVWLVDLEDSSACKPAPHLERRIRYRDIRFLW